MKKITSLAALAVLTLTAAPAFAATATDTVKVQWNVQATAAIKAYANYAGTAAAPTSTNAVGTILDAVGATASTANTNCAGAAPGAAAPYFVDFGAVTPDAASTVECEYKNAVAVQVVTNSVSWNVKQQLGAALPAGYKLCAANNGALVSGAVAITPSAATTATLTTNYGAGTCPLGTDLGGAALTAFTSATTAGTQAIGEDLTLIVPAAAGVGASAVYVLTFTLTAN